jgi:hypothetical protein
MENIKEINTDEIKSKLKDKKEKSGAWESGIKILKKMEVVIPLKLLLVCNQIADKVHGDEFSIVTNILEKDDTEITLSEEFYIPKQQVSHSNIEYLPDDYKFNTVIHRHPDSCNSFSNTDAEYINQNFELSILYTKIEGFVNGLYNLRHESGYLIQIPVEIYVDYGIQEIDISNIQKPAPLMVIDKFHKRHRNKKEKFKNTDATFDIDLDRIEREDKFERDDKKLLLEEKLDYAMMKDFMLEDVTEQLQGMEYRLDNLEDMIYHQANFGINGSPF